MGHGIQNEAKKKFLLTMLEQYDEPDRQPPVCAHFGCPTHLTLYDILCGKYCQQHSIMKNESQPSGEQDPVLFVSY
jgi:hypothetical protein